MPRTLRLFAPPKRVVGPLLVVLLVLVIVLPLLSSLGWVMGEYVLARTSGVKFCSSCHSMQPMAEAYRMDVHGGHSTHGVQAACADCHLPRDSAFGFMLAYWRRLIGDGWVELIHGSVATNWEGLREQRATYVFDSGCIGCHANLLEASPRNGNAFTAHETYFQSAAPKKCVTCHASVGHKNLGTYLSNRN